MNKKAGELPVGIYVYIRNQPLSSPASRAKNSKHVINTSCREGGLVSVGITTSAPSTVPGGEAVVKMYR